MPGLHYEYPDEYPELFVADLTFSVASRYGTKSNIPLATYRAQANQA